MLKSGDIKGICNEFDIVCDCLSNVIDTSRGEEDRRYNYKINSEYFLKVNSSKAITESFLNDILKLIKRYESIGVYCPNLIRSKQGTLSYKYSKDGVEYTCYLEECVPYNFYESEEIDYEFKKNVVKHLGKLANNFTGVDLSQTRSMWSLIELGPFDIDKDEKQENIDTFISKLQDMGYHELAKNLAEANKTIRNRIESKLDKLPRCVYQGDLNECNIVVDENGDFKGVIDFNMFGTEVNINCFLNETMYYLRKEDFETLTAKEILNKMKCVQAIMMEGILESYKLNCLELEVLQDYKKIIYLSFYPNVMLWIDLLEEEKLSDKVIELINLILTMED